MNNRLRRKKEHLILAGQGSRCSFANFFSDIILPHDCLTETNPHEVELSTELCGYTVCTPLFINAITGGALISEHVNRNLALLAARLKLPMAVGSQMAGLKAKGLRFTYAIVRKLNPNGLVMANLSASATPRQALEAVNMVEAQILQLHLNPAQEFVMPEGDCVSQGVIENITEICAALSIPVLVKEVGFGIAAAQAKLLAKAGVNAIDISGSGGTNFARIEGLRNSSTWWKPFTRWGLPTPLCVADLAVNAPEVQVVASGGISNGIKALKCMALGATAVGIAGSVWRHLYRQGPQEAEQYLRSYLKQIQVGMALMGINRIAQLNQVPLLISGQLKDLLLAKGVNPVLFSTRGK